MFTRTAGIVAAGTQNRRVISVGYRMCYRTHRIVGYCGITVTELTEVQGIVYRSLRVISVGYLICYRTHRSIGYCGATVTELTEVLCRVKTEGNYPRYRSVGTLQNLSVKSCTNSMAQVYRFLFLYQKLYEYQSRGLRAGPDMKMFKRRIGHAPINFTNLDLIFDTVQFMHQSTP